MNQRPLRFDVVVSLLSVVVWLAAVIGARGSDFNDGWRFHLGDAPGAEVNAFSDADWETVTLPHPARVEALVTNKKEKQQWEGICWYRKTFTLPPGAAGQVVSRAR